VSKLAVKLVKCSECKTEKKMGLYEGEETRLTYCRKCGCATNWTKIIKREET